MKYIVCLILFSFAAVCYRGDEFWIDMDQAKPGQLVRTVWEDVPVAVLYRTDEMIEDLRNTYGGKGQGTYRIFRSNKPEYFVFIDEHEDSGERLKYTRVGDEAEFYDAKLKMKFDASGRGPDSEELEVPRYKFVTNTKMVFISD